MTDQHKRHLQLASLRRVIVPWVHGGRSDEALQLAQQLSAGDVTLIGVVPLPANASLSMGAATAQELRRHLRQLSREASVRARSQVLVTTQPWADLRQVIEEEAPDLVVLDIQHHLPALGVEVGDVLRYPPANIALLRGPLLAPPQRVLAAVRGGPFSELALRIGLNLRPQQLTSLHVRLRGRSPSEDEAFEPLRRVLANMPEVSQRTIETDDTLRCILDEAKQVDLLVLGATAPAGVGYVASALIAQAPCAVLIVATRQPAPTTFDARASAKAISLLVDKWFAENTFQADEFDNLHQLVDLKRQQNTTISLALPALNEEETVGNVISTIKRALFDEVPLLDEIVLIDSQSTDRTREIAAELGVPVYVHQELLPRLQARRGKGEALWKSLLVTRGDIIVWIDTDIVNVHPRFVYGIIGPMLVNPRVQFVKGFYRRPLRVGERIQADAGGRVTELTARPLINLFYPELSGVIQPLSGEYGGRRAALEQCSFFSGYGVEIGLLIDIYEKFGLSAVAQVDLLERIHRNQTLEALSKMSFAIIQAVMRKLESRYERRFIEDVNKSMKLIRYGQGGYYLEVEQIEERERPPMSTVEEYLQRREASR